MIILDRDETLNHDPAPGYLRDVEKLELLPHVGESLALLKNLGFILVVATNQSGVGRGYFNEETLRQVHQRMDELLQEYGVVISEYFVCTHAPHDNCNCRKPKNGLVKLALQKFLVAPENAYVIGDRLRDIEAGSFANIDGIWLNTHSQEQELPTNLKFRAHNLKEAAEWIAQHEFEKIISAKVFNEKQKQELEAFLHKQQNKKIIFTNGCFDILHAGHMQYLWQAKSLGDILMVGLNSDQSVRNLKGEQRPVHTWADRALMLASLDFVSAVVEFSEPVPNALIEKIRPHVHVKGGDYQAKDLPEYPLLKNLGSEVAILSFRKGYSTTKFLQRIKKK